MHGLQKERKQPESTGLQEELQSLDLAEKILYDLHSFTTYIEDKHFEDDIKLSHLLGPPFAFMNRVTWSILTSSLDQKQNESIYYE